MPGALRGLLDARATGQHDQVGERDLLAAGLRAAELALDALQRLEHLRQLGGLVDVPPVLRRETNASAVRAAALVGAAERGRRRPRGRHQLRHGQTRRQDLALERGEVLRVDQVVIDRGDGVLPDELFGGNLGAEVAGPRAHIAVRQLEPRPGECVGELIRVLVEAPRDLLVGGVEPQREVRGQHGRRVTLGLVVGIRNRAGACAPLRSPLMRARRALCQFPLVAEQVLEVVVAPLRGRGGPGDLQAAGDRVTAHARAEGAPPAQPLLLEAAPFGLRPHIGLEAGAVGLAEGVAAGDERHRLLVVHGHARESLADIPGRRDRVWIAVRALRVDVDQPHLNGAERILEIPDTGVPLVPQPLVLGAPVDLIRLPDVRTSAGEPEGLETHRFQRDVAREDHEVGPGELPAVLLLDRPQQSARLVEVPVVGPAVEGRETLLAGPAAAAAVGDSVRTGAVPGHADEQRSVVAEVGRPPGLRVGHHRREILLHRRQVEALELLGVVEVLAHGIGQGQHLEVQLIGPPVSVRDDAASRVRERALCFGCHLFSPLVCGSPTSATSSNIRTRAASTPQSPKASFSLSWLFDPFRLFPSRILLATFGG